MRRILTTALEGMLCAAGDRLTELARADDAAGFSAQWAAVRQTCGTCHDGYRTQ